MSPEFPNKNSGTSAPSALTDLIERECYMKTGKASTTQQVCEHCVRPFTAPAESSMFTSCYSRGITLAISQHSSLFDNPKLWQQKDMGIKEDALCNVGNQSSLALLM